MKFLVDMMLSTEVAERLRNAGHDAVHARDYGLQRALDQISRPEVPLSNASCSRRTRISASFWRLAHSSSSVVQLHRLAFQRVEFVVALLLANLPQLTEALEHGMLIMLEEHRIRVRRLPINRMSRRVSRQPGVSS